MFFGPVNSVRDMVNETISAQRAIIGEFGESSDYSKLYKRILEVYNPVIVAAGETAITEEELLKEYGFEWDFFLAEDE
jgi:hypothetical protein